jgi:hypothetical protein
MPEASQSPTPSNGNTEGTDLRSAAASIEGLLSEDDSGRLNVGNDRISRAHPDYDETKPHDQQVKPERDTKGKFKKAATPDEQDQVDQTAEADQLAEGDVEHEDTDDQQAEGDTNDQLAESANQEAEQNDAETDESIRTVADMAGALEMSVDEFLNGITDTFGAAGEETTVTLSELRAGYQKDADYRRQTSELADRRRAAETDYTTRMTQYDDQNRYLSAHLNASEQYFAGQFDDPGLAALRHSDPAEWSARREEIGGHLNQIRQARDHATQQYGAFQTQQLLDLKAREGDALQRAMPDFTPTVHGEQARKVMETLGYAPAETAKIFDHRLVLAAIELGALRTEVETLRAEKSRAKDTVKRVTKDIPRLAKPGKKTEHRPIQRNNVEKLKARAKKSGTLEDAAAVIENMQII